MNRLNGRKLGSSRCLDERDPKPGPIIWGDVWRVAQPGEINVILAGTERSEAPGPIDWLLQALAFFPAVRPWSFVRGPRGPLTPFSSGPSDGARGRG